MKKLIFLPILLQFFSCSIKIPDEYVIDEVDLVPECIAYSEQKGVFYLTSIAKRKIIELDRKTGKQKDFIEEAQFGYNPGAGIYIDDKLELLYAIGGYFMTKDSITSLFTFDLNKKILINRYNVTDNGEHFLNDLIKDRDGNIYLTDTKNSSIYILRAKSDSLINFFESKEIEFPNGIAISDDNTKLFIASSTKGIRILDINHKNILNESDRFGTTKGIDGLEFYKGNLYAVQNGLAANGYNFRKLILNKTQDKIIDFEVIEENSSNLDLPLTFCIFKNKAIVIGNSNLQYYDQQKLEFRYSGNIPNTKLITYTIN